MAKTQKAKAVINGEAGYYYNEKNTAHYVGAFEGTLNAMSRCGKRSAVGWHESPLAAFKHDPTTCGRCTELRMKDQMAEIGDAKERAMKFEAERKDVESGETLSSGEEKPEEEHMISLNMQVVGDVTPVAHVPVPDLEQVILMLQSLPINESALLAHAVRDAAVTSLRKYVGEAIKRAEIPMTSTWSYAKKK